MFARKSYFCSLNDLKDMDEATYKFLMGASAFMIAILGVMLATTMIRPENGLEKLRKARNILVPSYLVLALLSLICCLTGYDRRIEPASTLFVASFQALLFTMSMLVFIRPTEVRWKTVLRQAAGITVAGIILFVALFCLADYYPWFFYGGIIAYAVQLIIYTRKFRSAYRKTVKEVEDYYDDDEESRLRWVKIGFYSALGIGAMAISVLFFNGWYKFFVPLYVVYYSFMVMWFVNYYHRMQFAIPVIAEFPQEKREAMDEPEAEDGKADADEPETEGGNEPTAEKIPTDMEQMLHERLRQYVARKEYCRKDVPADEVVASLSTTKAFLRKYMNEHYAMWFSTWRNELRIHEACILWEEKNDITIADMVQKTGYANSGNFCRDFKKIVGITPREYCIRMRTRPEPES